MIYEVDMKKVYILPAELTSVIVKTTSDILMR